MFFPVIYIRFKVVCSLLLLLCLGQINTSTTEVVTCLPGGLAGVWKGVIGEVDDISPGLPLVRLVVLATDEEEEEETEEEARGSGAGDWVAGGVLGTPVGDGRRVRE